ncbi:MAG TPA: ribosome maturation factor RimP [Steroidobacteraceae bacterium]|nr:ribosome maturation factor RimP [Steroidobacteraceae bacterium]
MLRDDLIALLSPVVQGLELQVWELEYAGRPGGGLLRIYIDSPHGITVEDCANVSRAVSEVLDASDPIPGEYTLEVSSPGLDRVLRSYEHFSLFAGEPVKVEMKTAIAGRKRFSGRLLKVEREQITVDVDGKQVVMPLAGIHKARLAPELAS